MLFDEFHVYQALKVGSVEPFEIGQLVIGLGLLHGFKRRLQVGTRGQRRLAEAVERIERIGEIEDPGHVELVQRRAIVQELQQLDLGRAQVNDRRLQLRFVLHAQQLDAIEVDLGDVAGLEPRAADLDDLVVVIEIRLGHVEHRLGLERLHKCRAQRELQVALQVLVLRFGNARAFLRAFQPQLAFVIALVQVTEVGLHECALERLPHAIVGRDLSSVGRRRQLWIRPQIRGDLFGAHLVHVVGIGLQRRIGGLKPGLDLIPR